MWVNFPGVDFLEMVLRKKKIVVAYYIISSITHEIRHLHVTVMQ